MLCSRSQWACLLILSLWVLWVPHALAQIQEVPAPAPRYLAPITALGVEEEKPAGEKPSEEKAPAKAKPAEEDEAVVEVAPTQPASPDAVRVFLMDGSVISGKLSLTELHVETSYGSLTIPVASLRSFTPGLGSHPELGTKIHDYIDDLGSSDFGEREAASKALQEMGLSIRLELEKRANDPDTERRTRIKNLLTELDEQETDEEEVSEEGPAAASPILVQRDIIETTEFTVVGKIVPKSFTIVSLYGPLNVKLSDIRRTQRDVGEKPELRKSLAVDGSHIVQTGFKSSGIRVERGDRVSVTADGTLTMTPWGNETLCTPDGGQNYGWYLPGQITGGSLIAKIGESGTVFKVGSKNSFVAERAGVLQFAIAMQQDYASNAFPGKYNVKLRVKRKQ